MPIAMLDNARALLAWALLTVLCLAFVMAFEAGIASGSARRSAFDAELSMAMAARNGTGTLGVCPLCARGFRK